MGDFIFIYSISNPLDLVRNGMHSTGVSSVCDWFKFIDAYLRALRQVFSNSEAEQDFRNEDVNLRFHHRRCAGDAWAVGV